MNIEVNITDAQIERAIEKAVNQKVNAYFKKNKWDIEYEWQQATYLCIKELLNSEEGKAVFEEIKQDAFARKVAEHLSKKFFEAIVSSLDNDFSY